MLSLPVDFGTVSFGKETVRIAVKCSRSELTLTDAAKQLCSRRITGELKLKPGKALPGMDGMDGKIRGTFDVTRLGMGKDDWTFGCTYKLSEIDADELIALRCQSGFITIKESAAIPSDAPQHPEPDEEGNGSVVAAGRKHMGGDAPPRAGRDK